MKLQVSKVSKGQSELIWALAILLIIISAISLFIQWTNYLTNLSKTISEDIELESLKAYEHIEVIWNQSEDTIYIHSLGGKESKIKYLVYKLQNGEIIAKPYALNIKPQDFISIPMHNVVNGANITAVGVLSLIHI